MAIEDALREHLADLTDPVIHLDFGAAQAQRRFAAHRDAVCALTTTETPIGDRAQPVGIPAPEHLVHKPSLVGRMVTRVDACEPGPVLGKDRFEDVPGRRSCCSQHAASLRNVGVCVIALFYHIPPTTSPPSSAFPGAHSPTPLTLEPRGLHGNPQMEIPVLSRRAQRQRTSQAMSSLRLRPSTPLGHHGEQRAQGSGPPRALHASTMRQLQRSRTGSIRNSHGCCVCFAVTVPDSGQGRPAGECV